MSMQDYVEATDSVDLDGDVVMERDTDKEEVEDKEEEDKEEDPEDEEEDEVNNDGKEPRTIGQGEILNTSDPDVNTMVGDQPIVLP